MLDITKKLYERIFVVGAINGDYESLVEVLYEQRFDKNDLLIATGDIINETVPDSIRVLDFFMQNPKNTFSVLGKNEESIIRYIENNNFDKLSLISGFYPTNILPHTVVEYLKSLDPIAKVSDKYYVVNAGIKPRTSLSEQPEDVYYNIGDYDKESRFYDFSEDEGLSWYQYEITNNDKPIYIISGKKSLGDVVEVPAGYVLGRQLSEREPLKFVVIPSHTDGVILIKN